MSKNAEGAGGDVTADLAAIREDVARLAETISKLMQRQTRAAGPGAAEAVGDARDSIASTAADAGNRARAASGEIEASIERNPLTAVLIAFGIGMCAMRVLPVASAIFESPSAFIEKHKSEPSCGFIIGPWSWAMFQCVASMLPWGARARRALEPSTNKASPSRSALMNSLAPLSSVCIRAETKTSPDHNLLAAQLIFEKGQRTELHRVINRYFDNEVATAHGEGELVATEKRAVAKCLEGEASESGDAPRFRASGG